MELSLTLITEAPKFARLCEALREHRTTRYVPLVPLKPGDGFPPVFIIHGLGGNVAGLFPMTRRMTYPGAVIGIQARGLNGKEPPHATVEAMAAEYLREVKARQPDGPYYLCGYSFGGLVAFEMARRLRESGEADVLLRRHLEWHLGLAEQAAPQLQGPDQASWLDRLQLDYDDFRAALEWVRAEGSCVEEGARLAGALHRFWALRGYFSEGREWLEGILSNGRATSVPAKAKAAYGAGALASLQGDYGRAEALNRESLRLYRELGDTVGIALSLNTLGFVARNQGEYSRARTLLEESLTLSRESGHTWVQAEALNILGVAARRQGDHGRATVMFEESQALWRELGDKWGLAFSLGHLGVVARLRGDYEKARALHEESLALRRQLGDRRNIATALNSLGVVARHLGDYRHAETLLEESLDLFRELGDKPSIAATLCNLGFVEYHRGDDGRAAALLQESLVLFREQEDKLNSAVALCNLGFVAFHQGDYNRAAALHRESLGMYLELGNESGIADCLAGQARVAAAREQAELAARLLGAAEALRKAKGMPLPPSDRADYERDVAATRAHLSADAFAASWAHGQTMSLEEAIREAMR